jgi:hypothetical protein
MKSAPSFVDALPFGVIVSRTWDPNKPQILRANRARVERIELGGRPVMWDE